MAAGLTIIGFSATTACLTKTAGKLRRCVRRKDKHLQWDIFLETFAQHEIDKFFGKFKLFGAF